MVYSPQWQATRPAGVKKRKLRYSPIVEEQALAGTATKNVMAAKEKALQKEQFEFEKQSTQDRLALQERQFAHQRKQDKYGNWLGGITAAIGLGDLFGAGDWLDDIFDFF